MKKYIKNSDVRRRKSEAGIELVFVPGEDCVNELNEEASVVLEQFASPKTREEVRNNLLKIYSVDNINEFTEQTDQIIDRFLKRKILIECNKS